MTATIIQFPVKKKQPVTAYRIPLFGDDEVKLAVVAINLYGNDVAGVKAFTPATTSTLKNYKPEFVIQCIKLALASELFSTIGKAAFRKILSSVEEVKVS